MQAVWRFLPELDAVGQHPEAAPAPRAGNTGPAGVAPQLVLDLHSQDRPAGHDAALVRGGRAEADSRGARVPVPVRFSEAGPFWEAEAEDQDYLQHYTDGNNQFSPYRSAAR